MKVIFMDTRISTAALSPRHYKRLIFLAAIDNTRKASLAKDILVAYIDAHRQEIDLKLADCADEYGISVERLSDLILAFDADGQSTARLHEQLEEEKKRVQAREKENREECN
jgi:spore cortex formation protein SpoVR/YcgB (stage V sporulation)